MEKRILITGHGMGIVDQIFDRVDFSYIIQYCRSDEQDMKRYLYRLRPGLIIISLDAEVEQFYKNIHNILCEKDFKNIPVIIIGSSDDCTRFGKKADITVAEKLTKPVSTEIIEQLIKKFFAEEETVKDNYQYNSPEEEELWKNRYEQYLKAVAEQIDIKQHVTSMDDVVGELSEENIIKEINSSITNEEEEEYSNDNIDNDSDMNDEFSVDALVDDDQENKHILIVDDDVMMLKLLKSYLEEFYDVAVAISGSVALKFLEMHTTDLIILDYKMPEMSGSEVVSRLRINPKFKNIPVIFLTGVSDAETVRECLRLKPQGYALKPIPQDKLIEMVSGIIGL